MHTDAGTENRKNHYASGHTMLLCWGLLGGGIIKTNGHYLLEATVKSTVLSHKNCRKSLKLLSVRVTYLLQVLLILTTLVLQMF